MPDGKWARTDTEKAETFSTHLKSVFTPHPNDCPTSHLQKVHSFLSEDTVQEEVEGYETLKFTKEQVLREIKKINHKKAPGYDLITSRVLMELPYAGLILLTSIYNAMTRLKFFPPQWKVAKIIMVPKPDKQPEDPKSYRPLSLLPIASKVYEALLLTRILSVIHDKHLVPDHQFGFRHKHATIDQVHRLTNEIMKCFEDKKYCAAAFLDISQAFDKVWHEGLVYKIKYSLPHYLYEIVKSFLTGRHFMVQSGDATSGLCPISAGVPQGSVLGPILYLLYTADLPTNSTVTTGTFADDTAILAVDSQPDIATRKLQLALDDIATWLKEWRIKANENKSVNVTFTLRRESCPPVRLNNVDVPQADHVRYLGLHLDKRLTWQKHIFTKRKQLT